MNDSAQLAHTIVRTHLVCGPPHEHRLLSTLHVPRDPFNIGMGGPIRPIVSTADAPFRASHSEMGLTPKEKCTFRKEQGKANDRYPCIPAAPCRLIHLIASQVCKSQSDGVVGNAWSTGCAATTHTHATSVMAGCVQQRTPAPPHCSTRSPLAAGYAHSGLD